MGILAKSQARRRIGLSEYKNDPMIAKLMVKSFDIILIKKRLGQKAPNRTSKQAAKQDPYNKSLQYS